MKSLRNKVIMSAVVLVFAVIATIGSTYAWFTVSNTVEVNSFNVDVLSSEALLMRMWDGETYVPDQAYDLYRTADDGGNDLWTLNDFSNDVTITSSSQYDTEIAAALFAPVTCLNGEDQTGGKYLTDYSNISFHNSLRLPTVKFIDEGELATTGRELSAYNSSNANSATGGWIELKFWALTPSADATNVRFSYTITDNDGLLDYENAIWFGVEGDGNQFIYGDDIDLGFSWTGSMPGIAGVGNTDLNAVATNAATLSGATVEVISQTDDDAIPGYDFTAHLGEGTSNVLTLVPNVPEIITVYIWAEGWDSDANNNIMGADFDIDFIFTLV